MQPLALIKDIRVAVHIFIDGAWDVHVLSQYHVISFDDGEGEQDYHEQDGHERSHASRQEYDALREWHLILMAELVPT